MVSSLVNSMLAMIVVVFMKVRKRVGEADGANVVAVVGDGVALVGVSVVVGVVVGAVVGFVMVGEAVGELPSLPKKSSCLSLSL
jgi:hypothetical protein